MLSTVNNVGGVRELKDLFDNKSPTMMNKSPTIY
jgi:hypothetical protein